MVGGEIGDLDLAGDGVTMGDGGVARGRGVFSALIVAMVTPGAAIAGGVPAAGAAGAILLGDPDESAIRANPSIIAKGIGGVLLLLLPLAEDGHVAVHRLAALVMGEGAAREPIIPVAGLALLAVRVEVTLLPIHIVARQNPPLEALLRLLLLGLRGKIPRVQELIHEVLILADAVAEHPRVVPVMVNAPLDIDDLTAPICGNNISPGNPWHVEIDRGSLAVATWAAAADGGRGDVGPGWDGLQDGAL